MKCQHVEARFSAFVEGDLDERSLREVRAHLEDCAQCAAALEGFRSALSALQAHGRPATTPDLVQGILAGVDAAARDDVSSSDVVFERAMRMSGALRRTRRRSTWASHSAAVLAGAAAVLLIAFFQWDRFSVSTGRGTTLVADIELPDRNVEPSGVPEAGVEPIEPALSGTPTTPADPIVIERIVEVSRPVIFERVVERGPLFELNFAGLASAFDRATSTLMAWNTRLDETRLLREPVYEAPHAKPASLETRADSRSRAAGPHAEANLVSTVRNRWSESVVVDDLDGQVIIRLNGPTSVVISDLLDELAQAEGKHAQILERCFAEIYREVREQPQFRERLSPYLPEDPTLWWESIRAEYMELEPTEILMEFRDAGNSSPSRNVRVSV